MTAAPTPDFSPANIASQIMSSGWETLEQLQARITAAVSQAYRLGMKAGEQGIIADAEVLIAAKSLGKRGGALGGVRRAQVLSPERRKEIARIAANTRWQKEVVP